MTAETFDDIFTADDVAFAETHPALGPCYEVGRRVTERFMANFKAEHFASLTEEIAKAFQARIYADIDAHLLSDCESNLESTMRHMVDSTVNAIITGKPWALERYVFAKYHDGKEIREAIVAHCREQLESQRIADMEAEIAGLKETVTRLRERY